MAPKKTSKSTKSLKHSKKLEPTKPLAIDSYMYFKPYSSNLPS